MTCSGPHGSPVELDFKPTSVSLPRPILYCCVSSSQGPKVSPELLKCVSLSWLLGLLLNKDHFPPALLKAYFQRRLVFRITSREWKGRAEVTMLGRPVWWSVAEPVDGRGLSILPDSPRPQLRLCPLRTPHSELSALLSQPVFPSPQLPPSWGL